MTKRDLDFFMANPGEMPADLNELETALQGGDQVVGDEETTTDETGEQGAASGASGGEKAAKEGAGGGNTEGGAKQANEPPPVIESKNGKHAIPYSVLESERQQRQAADARVAELQAQIQALTTQVAGGKTPAADGSAKTAAADTTSELSPEEIEQIAADYPEHAKVLKALLTRVDNLQGQLAEVRTAEGSRAQREARSASSTAQEAIDANPTLSYWQTKEPEMFQRAISFDNLLRADPRNSGLTLDERFTKVVGAVEAVHGPTQLPDEFRRGAAAPTPPAAKAGAKTPQGKAADPAQAAVDKAIADAQAANRVTSLSDIPGGVPGESDEVTQLGQLSAHELGNRMLNMDPKALSALLARA